ncbi:UDP-glycosyltransferase 75C1-like [Tripterygium wilfordii]|uniref:UDP-glycosyltransferase 75C1-like n=1 Tax=Tripterygium wilfordii TaxID=458696 RepID=UPI0018F83A78|nr:UDP-glycosyltransferase 75C1-like [Tripterygium wilfordii]
MAESPHVLLVSFPSQGHINPALQFAIRLVHAGVQVTFATTFSAHKNVSKPQNTLPGLSFVGFSDGYDEAFSLGVNLDIYMSVFKHHGMKNLKQVILNINNDKESRPITRVFYCNLIPWVALVGRELHIPSTLLWNQAAAVLDIYYYNFHGYEGFIRDNIVNEDSFSLRLPRLPPLSGRDLPPFFLPSNVHEYVLPTWKAHVEVLDEEETKPIVLVNTFDALETEALKSIENYTLIGVGPLIPSAFLEGKDPSDHSLRGDLFKSSESKNYTDWLNLKGSSSVIYISFGSLSVLDKPQMEEVARALIGTGRPFLWVNRENQKGEGKQEEELSCRGELEKQGMIVPWCPQVEVLSHPSLGCFVTHCGWNSTFESLASGVPMVAFPQWTDQMPNAKMVEDVWKTGVRVRKNEAEGLVEADEIKRCLELVMGSNERGEKMRRNAKKWKDLAREAAMEGGSSDKNLKTFVNEVLRG